MERLKPDNPYYPYVSVNPNRLGGMPVFRGTRVPVKNLFDYLREGDDLDTFLDDFEGVTREQAQAVIDLAAGGAQDRLSAA
jgi:uncharacterized protein (DUF433 family)